MKWMPLSAALLGALAVIAGAGGAHALKATLTPEALAWWQTGALYHLIHALVLLVAATVPLRHERARKVACIALVAASCSSRAAST